MALPVDLAPIPAVAKVGPLGIGEALGTRYRILRVLGEGGMGVVYHAWDDALGVAVALKVIRPEVMSDPMMAREVERRFKRELLLARQVTHRNVVRIHDLGEVEGIKYLTMPFVEGENLAHILREAGRLPVSRALAIAREIAAGLTAAHDAGVVHRDLKPENIMVEGEHYAQIMDFGISRSSRATGVMGGPPGGGAGGAGPGFDKSALMAGLTMAGAVIGTVQYMAPEQAKGQEADQRADIYAFGLIFRDMLVGSRQRAGQSALDELRGRMQEAPTGPRSIDEQIPEPIDRIIRRCVEPDPAARYQSTPELAADLDRLDAEGQPLPEPPRFTRRQLVAGVVLLLALIGGTWWLAYTPPPPPELQPVSVLIADFENQTSDPVFEGSLEQALNLAIEGASFISAYPRADAARVAADLKPGSRIDTSTARLIAGREGIDFILAGSIAKSGSGYDITVKTLDPAREEPVATESSEASSKAGVLEAVGAVAASIREQLGDRAPETDRLAAADSFTASSLEAVKTYSLAQDLQNRGRKSEALAAYRRAIELDPKFGLAHSGAAVMAFELGRTEEAEGLWKKMLTLMDRMTERERYRTLGNYYLGVARNYEKAIENYSNLVKAYPADRTGRANLALAYFWSLNIPKALEEGRRAVELNPKNLLHRSNYALYAMYAGDFDTAAKETARVVEQEPAFYVAYVPLAMAALARGDATAAREVYGRMAKTGAAGASLAAMGLADIALYEGRYSEAEATLRLALGEDRKAGNVAGMAAKYVALGEAYEGLRRPALAVNAANSALKLARAKEVQMSAAAILLRAGQDRLAKNLASELSQQLPVQARAYGKILEGRLALKQRRLVDAVEAFLAAQKLADLWIARFDLGIAYLEADHHAEGLVELETCQKRRGEATAIFLDDVPSFRYLASLPYWLGRAQEGVGRTPAAIANYKSYLALRSDTPRDRLAIDARRRLGSL